MLSCVFVNGLTDAGMMVQWLALLGNIQKDEDLNKGCAKKN